MTDKSIVSLRFSSKYKDRINPEEWESFKKLADYFNISNGKLIEAAFKFSNNEDINGEIYKFNQKSYDQICSIVSNLSCLRDSLICGKLNKEIDIIGNNISLTVRKESDVRFYPPYIIAIEPTYDIRIAIDLMKEIVISEDKNKIIIKY